MRNINKHLEEEIVHEDLPKRQENMVHSDAGFL